MTTILLLLFTKHSNRLPENKKFSHFHHETNFVSALVSLHIRIMGLFLHVRLMLRYWRTFLPQPKTRHTTWRTSLFFGEAKIAHIRKQLRNVARKMHNWKIFGIGKQAIANVYVCAVFHAKVVKCHENQWIKTPVVRQKKNTRLLSCSECCVSSVTHSLSHSNYRSEGKKAHRHTAKL